MISILKLLVYQREVGYSFRSKIFILVIVLFNDFLLNKKITEFLIFIIPITGKRLLFLYSFTPQCSFASLRSHYHLKNFRAFKMENCRVYLVLKRIYSINSSLG